MRTMSWIARFRCSVFMLLANVTGAALFLRVSSFEWSDPREIALGIASRNAGDPIIWGLTALPILALFALVILAWGIWLVCKKDKENSWFWIGSTVMWFAVLLFNSRQA